MADTKLTQHRKVIDQINKTERLETKLKYGLKGRDHILRLPKQKMITN